MRKTLLSTLALLVCCAFLFVNGQGATEKQWTRVASEQGVQVAPAPTAPPAPVFTARSAKTPPFNLYENFDGFADWATDLTPWTTIQVTSGPTYGSNSFDFPGEAAAWAVKVFNPSLTDPPINTTHPPQDGSKYAVFIQYTGLNDNKWLISPEVSINATSELSFYAKSITLEYGAERIKVMVSTTNNEPASFTKISAGDYIEVPVEWTQYTFDLSAYAGETIYFAIQYVSYDAFICMIDAIKLEADEGPAEIGWANLQWPATGNIQTGAEFNVYGKVWIDGVTGGATAADGLQAWVGYSTENTNPNTWTNWVVSSHQGADVNNDEFVTNLGAAISAEGTYYYATRYKYLDHDHVYGGFNGGFWDGTGNVSGVLTVSDAAPSTHNVTFNVDMTDATGFNHSTHEVWMTGDLLGWSMPGTGNSKQLSLVTGGKDATVIYEEGFEPANASGALPEGWEVKKANNPLGNDLQDLADGDRRWIRFSEQSNPYTTYTPAWTRTGDASMHINWNVEAVQNAYAITPVIDLPAASELTMEFWMYFPGSYHTELDILILQEGTWTVLRQLNSTDHANLYASAVLIDLTGKVGSARFAFVYKWTDGIQMNIDDIKVYGVLGSTEPDELIYTVTLPVEAGDIAYKFFSTHVDTGWDGGEWVGDPNRTATIAGDVTLNHVWGVQQPTSVDEIALDFETRVFPNPVRGILTIQSQQNIDNLRLLDMSGRQVYNVNVNGFEATVDVSNMNQGLYILQLMSGNQVKTHKIQVVR